MTMRRQAGGTVLIVLFALLLVAGAGAANYYRNWTDEQRRQAHRTFGGYTDEALEQLAGAYQSEIDAWMARFKSKPQASLKLGDTGSVGRNIDQFDRARQASAQRRDLGNEVAKRKARLQTIRREQKIRANAVGAKAHIRRLTKI